MGLLLYRTHFKQSCSALSLVTERQFSPQQLVGRPFFFKGAPMSNSWFLATHTQSGIRPCWLSPEHNALALPSLHQPLMTEPWASQSASSLCSQISQIRKQRTLLQMLFSLCYFSAPKPCFLLVAYQSNVNSRDWQLKLPLSWSLHTYPKSISIILLVFSTQRAPQSFCASSCPEILINS